MSVLITLHDVEPAVRLNARLEADGVETIVVSPLDDMRAEIRRAKPDLIVLSAELTIPPTSRCLREMLWDGTPVVGLMDGDDPRSATVFARSATSTYFPKPIVVDDVALSVRRIVERHALQELTGLIGRASRCAK
jgi:DNA-binding response OmpR family regulator